MTGDRRQETGDRRQGTEGRGDRPAAPASDFCLLTSVVNRYRGEDAISIEGREYRLRFTWDALARLKERFGDHDQALAQAVSEDDVEVLAEFIAQGSGGRLSAEEVMAASPPVALAGRAVISAMRAAYYGPAGGPEPEDKKKAARGTFLSRLFRPRQRPGSRRRSSGG